MKAVYIIEQLLQEQSYGCLMAEFDPEDARDILDYGKSIPDDELAQDARETIIHVTCLYGFTSPEAASELKEFLQDYGPISFKLGKTSLFEAVKYAKDAADVLKIEISGADLHKLNKALRDNFDYESDYPKYVPHATIAYVLPGEGKKYAGDTEFEGRLITVNELVYSSKDNKRTTIPLD